jgi:hypothetical protein
MRIEGEWWVCEDGMPRPAVRVRVAAANGLLIGEYFFVDTLADRTVFSAEYLGKLGLATQQAPPDHALAGIGGQSMHVLLTVALEFIRDDGVQISVNGQFAAFTDPTASDLSLLGRDVLNNFDVIVSRPRNEVLLLAPNHQYQVVRA